MSDPAALRDLRRMLTKDRAVPEVIGPWRVGEEIGRGGFGTVHRVHHVRLGREGALKLYGPVTKATDAGRKRFRRGCVLAAGWDHPHLLRVLDGGIHENRPWIVTELVAGHDLLVEVRDHGRLPLPRVREVVLAVVRALGYLHAQDVVHRDVKPSNVLCGDDGAVRLGDFDLARSLEPDDPEASELTAAGAAIGTAAYMAPEVFRGADPDPKADVWALGVLWYELLAGEPAYGRGAFHDVYRAIEADAAAPIADLRGDLDLAEATLVMRLMAHDPARRPTDMRQVESILAPLLPPPARPKLPPPTPRRSARVTATRAATAGEDATESGKVLSAPVPDPETRPATAALASPSALGMAPAPRAPVAPTPTRTPTPAPGFPSRGASPSASASASPARAPRWPLHIVAALAVVALLVPVAVFVAGTLDAPGVATRLPASAADALRGAPAAVSSPRVAGASGSGGVAEERAVVPARGVRPSLFPARRERGDAGPETPTDDPAARALAATVAGALERWDVGAARRALAETENDEALSRDHARWSLIVSDLDAIAAAAVGNFGRSDEVGVAIESGGAGVAALTTLELGEIDRLFGIDPGCPPETALRRRVTLWAILGGEAAAVDPDALALGRAAREAGVHTDHLSAVRRLMPRPPGDDAQRALASALDWLARHQEASGAWSVDGWFARCAVADACAAPSGVTTWERGDARFDVGVSALATQAFLAAGRDPRAGDDAEALAAALGWLLERQHFSGAIGVDDADGASLYGHALSTAALARALALTDAPELVGPTDRALAFAAARRDPDGGWGEGESSDVHLTALMAIAIDEGRRAGRTVPASALTGARGFVERMTDAEGRVGYRVRGEGAPHAPFDPGAFRRGPTLVAAGLRVLRRTGEPSSSDASRRAVARLLAEPPAWPFAGDARSVDLVHWHHGTAAIAAGDDDEAWSVWRGALVRALAARQRTDGDASGSWEPAGAWCAAGGRVYATAINALTLAIVVERDAASR